MARVRKAQTGDLERVQYVCRMTAGEEAQQDEAVGEVISRMYSTYYIRECADTCFVLADDEDRAVGYILCEPDYKRYSRVFRETDVPEIKRLNKKDGLLSTFLPIPYRFFGKKYPAHLHIDILPEYQNQGYGSVLLKALLGELQSRGIKGVMLIASADNTGAIRFYERHSFKTVIKSNGINAIIMAKKLK